MTRDSSPDSREDGTLLESQFSRGVRYRPSTGPSNLTKDQQNSLDELVKAVSKLDRDLALDKDQLARFLRHSAYHVSKTIKKIEEYRSWSEEHLPFDITFDEVKEELETGKMFWHGEDKQGRPLLYLIAKKHMKGNTNRAYKLILYMICQALERMDNDAEFGFVMDRSETSMKNLDPDLPKRLIHAFQSYFPGRVGKLIIANPNMMFNTMFKAVRALMAPDLKAAVCVKSGKDWQKQLQQDVSPDMIPIAQGGSSKYEFSIDRDFDEMFHWTA